MSYLKPHFGISRAFSLAVWAGLALAAAPAVQAGKDFLGANWQSYGGIEIRSTPQLPENETHPSLWFNESELLAFRDRLDDDEAIRVFWDRVRNHRYLTMPFPEPVPDDLLRVKKLEKENARKVHQYYGDMTQIPLYCGFMAWMTDDPELREWYLSRAKAALLRAFDGPIYDLDPTKSGIDKSVDEIYRGIWSQSICAAYDFVQPFLTEEEDARIRGRLIKEAKITYRDLESWASGPHNHLSKPAWGLATLALTLSDEPEAAAWYEHAIKTANRNTRYHFSDDGIYREGTMYYLFSWLNFVPYLYHCLNVTGVDNFEAFRPVFEWGVISRNAVGWAMNVEDSFIRPVPTQMVAQAYADDRSFLNPEVPFSEVLQWNFRTTDYEPFREAEEVSGFNYTGASWDYPKELYDLITYDPSIKATPPSVDPTVFMAGGQTFFRSSWTNDPEDQSFLLFHSVPQADNHDHHDTLSFVLYAQNQMMASDSGYTRSGYSDTMRYTYYRRSSAHNTVTFNGIPLGDFRENVPNPSSDRLNTSFFDFEMKAAPFRLYLGESIGVARRSIAFVNNDYFLVLDELQGQQIGDEDLEGVFELYFHGGRSRLGREGDNYIWTYSGDRYGEPAKLLTRQLVPDSVTEVLEGESTYIKGDYAAFPALKVTRVDDEALFAQILFPLGIHDDPPEIEDLSRKDLLAARITTAEFSDVFLKAESGEGGRKAGLSFDGDFAWARAQAGRLSALAGQSVRRVGFEGEDLLRSSVPVTFALKLGVEAELGVDLERPTILRIHLSRPVQGVEFLGRPVPFEMEGDVLILPVEQSGNYRIR